MPITASIFLTLLVSAAPGGPEAGLFPGMISLRVDGRTIEGRPLAWNHALVRVLGRDGRLWQFPPDRATHWQQLSHRFTPVTISELRADLLRELGPGFEVATTTHYVVAHVRGQRDRWVNRFEALYREFITYFGRRGFKLREPEFPLVGIVLPDEAGFHQYALGMGLARPQGILGFYSLDTNRIVLYDVDSPGGQYWQETATTIIHEAAHQTAYNTGIHCRYAPPPLWVAEGLATLFEAPGVHSGRHYRTRADRTNRLRLADFQGAVAPASKPELLASMVAEDALFHEQPAAAYAVAWALTFYLVETQPDRYTRYLALTAARPPFTGYPTAQRIADFTSVFGDNWEMLEAQLLRFIAALPTAGP